MKKYANSALIYAILAMVGGVFFREFTKFNGFEGATTLAFVHTHYFALGMIVFLLLMLLENALHITDCQGEPRRDGVSHRSQRHRSDARGARRSAGARH